MNLFYRVCVISVACVGLALWATSGMAYPNYDGNPACKDCHPNFGGFGETLHDQHNTILSDCTLCHNSIGDNPPVSKCAGCHVQAGLVLHHTNAGAPADGNGLTCATCHPGMVSEAENVDPPYYALATVFVKDPCSGAAAPGEDFTGDGQGLDNDGNLAYDGNDSACQVPVEETTWGRIKALFEDA